MSLSGNILSRMQEKTNDINYSDKNKTEIKDAIQDWGEEKLRTEALIESGYNRQGVNHLSTREKLKQLHANIIILKKRKVHYKHHATLHKGRADAYRWKLKKHQYNPQQAVKNYFDKEEVDIEEEIQKAILEMVENAP